MKKTLLLAAVVVCSGFVVQAQQKSADVVENQFTTIKEVPITPVKDQANSGTCWSYSALGFLESEILRMGKPEVDLAEMHSVAQ